MLAGPLIAVIDDDDAMRGAIVELVGSGGYDACGFASAEAFLGREARHAIACIITDIQMPGMSGIDVKIHLSANHDTTPVIIITARRDQDLEQKALASGAVAFLRKPFSANALFDSLKAALTA